MKHEEIYNTVRMICGSLLMVGMFMIPSCEDNEAVSWLRHPDLEDHPDHKIEKKTFASLNRWKQITGY